MKKENKKLIVAFVIIALLIISIFALALEYQILGLSKSEETKQPLFVKIFVPDPNGVAPYTVNFTSLVLYSEGNVKYKWSFGDGNTSAEINPTHTYDKNNSFSCILDVIDGTGKNASDFVKINVQASQVPNVQIFLSETRLSRPFIPVIWRQGISQFYYGQKFRRLVDSKIFPKSLLNVKGFVSSYAVASSPQGNEILSYKWELRPPTYTSTLGQQRKPVYNFEGQNITIPLFYTYPNAPYDLTVIVTDSKGYQGSSTIKFNTELSPLETQILSIKTSIKTFRQQIWHNVLKAFLGETVGNAIFESIFPKLPNFPVVKMLLIVTLFANWGLSPGRTLIFNVSTQFLKKHPVIQNVVEKTIKKAISGLEKAKEKRPNLANLTDSLIDGLNKLLENLGLANKRPVLSNEIPDDGSKFLSTDYPEVAIKISDPEGDPFNVTIHGDYLNNITLLDQHNGTFIATLVNPLPNLTTIYWHVNVSYAQDKWVNATYKFSTW